jgi:hypothetical protein
LGTILRNQNWYEDIKDRLNSGNSIQNVLSSCVLYENVKIKIYRTVILSVVYVGVELGLSHSGKNVGCGYSRMGC